MKILLIEDEKDLSESIISYLKHENYLCETACNYKIASEKIAFYQYDCIIVDITLPDGNGLNVIKELKNNHSESGIIIISAKNTLGDKLLGLEIGADDYLTKPFHLSELNARIKSILRRRNFNGKSQVIFKEITVIPGAFQVYVNDSLIVLTRKEYELLIYFISNKDRVLTKESIAEHLWGDNIDMVDSFDFIYTHIKNLRKKIMEKGGEDYIKTIYGIGYKLITS